MPRRIPPPKLTGQPAKPLPGEPGAARRKQPAPDKKPLPDRAEVDRLVAELQAELTGDDRERAQEAARVCRLTSPRAAERLALIVYGLQAATPPQVTMASIAILKGSGVVGKGDAGVTAETTE